MPTKNTNTTKSPNALERVLPDLLQIPTNALRPVNLDITSMVVTIAGTLPALRELRPAIVAAAGEAYGKHIDNLEAYADAANLARADYLIAATPPDMVTVSDEVVAARDLLLADVTPLVKRKLISVAELGELRGSVGFRNQVLDLQQLVAIFRKHWDAIAAFTPVKLADLDKADALAKRFIDALGAREQGPAPTAELADLSQRAFTQAVNTYDQVRRAVSFLRWNEGDADDIAPSLWAGRGGRRAEVITTPVIAAPVVTDPATPVITTPAAPPVAPGLPGASPFVTQ